MNNEQIERYAYHISLSHHLSDFDTDADVQDVIDEINSGEANVWEPFENMRPESLLSSIFNLAHHIQTMFTND